MHQPSCPQSSVSPDTPAVVSSILLADSIGKSFPQNDALMKVITMASSKQQTLDCLKEFNWATWKKITKLCKKSFAEEYINVHKLFLNKDSSFKAIAHWYAPDNYNVLNY